MKNQKNANLVIRSSLAVALAAVIWSPLQVRSAEPAGMMMDDQMMEHGQEMMADMKVQDTQLTGQVAEMNRAPEDKKLDLLTAIVTQMVAQRTAMNARMSKMHGAMMKRMMQPMTMNTNSMSQDPMMQGKMAEQRREMMADMQAQDAQITGQIAQMNSAPADQKLDLLAAVVTQMVAQRTGMNTRMEKMRQQMLMNMPMGNDSMPQDPMMKGMKGMDEK